ncbi:DUF6766 family protein [Actinophytocola gossypii]|uniref:DUF2238 domain-containing protein n=1 Tax=Actinophytocola gossypii TaxID=2812003 RepID=A0ABT2J8S8_9PSEU|nr:DUF6766 family protein [Actinophytocola gossypii]MCT2584265.1 hypothetical protein [Actinophytocola gossypii]
MKRFLRDNGLGIAFGLLFLGTLVGQAVAGHADFNNRQIVDGGSEISFWSFLTTSEFAVDVAENWQSEYLQFLLYIFATVWLIQRGSPESKSPETIGVETDEQQQMGRYATEDSPKWVRAGGWRTAVFSRSLGITMGVLFLLSWIAQSIAGLAAYNSEQLAQLTDPVTWPQYVGSADFWNRTLQNWQSEFLAIGSMAVLSVYLRQRGSPESKPVGAAHAVTEDTG